MQLLFSGGDCLPLGEIADRVDDIFALCVQEVDDDPVYDPTEDRMRWEQNGERPSAIVEDLLGCGLLVAQAVVRVLQDKHAFAVHKDGDRDWYDDGASIYMKHFHASRDVAEKWTEFCSTLKHDARFLNQSAKTVLDEILKDAIEGKLPGLAAPIVSFGGPGTEERLFRARQADGLAAQKSILSAPAGQMGSPPPGLTSAGRMNAAGIGAFYVRVRRGPPCGG